MSTTLGSRHFGKEQSAAATWIGGIAFTFLIALAGDLLAKLPGFSHIGQLASAIIIAVLYRQLFGYPEAIKSGIQFSSKKLLRLAIILYGLKLNMHVIFQDGLGLVVRDSIIIAFAIGMTVWIGRLLKADRMITLLLGIGTGVCGAAAIAAVAPIVKSDDEDTAISVGAVALMGTVFSIGYTLIRPLLSLTDAQYGIWSGMSLHELAHVALAAAPAGQDALAVALLAKLGRVFLLIPLSLILIFLMNRKNGQKGEKSKIEFPYFLIGFIVLSFFGSYVLGSQIHISEGTMQFVNAVTGWLLTAAMVGLGLNVNLSDLRTKAFRPLIAMTITSLLVSVLAYIII